MGPSDAGRQNAEAKNRSAVLNSSRQPSVVAVILNWNNLPDTLECVDSVMRSDYPNLDVLVVDNDSRDDPTANLTTRFPSVRVLRTVKNLGYGGGNNCGLRDAIEHGAAYVLLLNNDAIVAQDMISKLVSIMEGDGRIALLTPRVFYYDRPAEVYWDGGTIDWEIGATPHDSRDLSLDGGIMRSEWLDGCAMLVRSAAARDFGLLDERYFLYFEDTEWSLRAARRGWVNAVAPAAHAWHKVSRSTGGIANPAVRFYFVRNRYLFLNAYRPPRGRARWRLRYVRGVFWDYIGIRTDRTGRRAVIAAFLSLLSHRWDTYETASRRQVVQVLDAILIAFIRLALPFKRLFRPRQRGPASPSDVPP